MIEQTILLGDEPIHCWFELSYAEYLTIPRSVLQSMPVEWQGRFVRCLEELDETIDWRPSEGCYWVRLKDSRGRFVHDLLMDYERGRRKIPHCTLTPAAPDPPSTAEGESDSEPSAGGGRKGKA